MRLADETLRKLLQRGERARVRGSNRTIRESFKRVDAPYWTCDRDALHARMRAAEKTGAVVLEWSKRGGDDRPLSAVRLASLAAVDRLAEFLGCRTREECCGDARRALGKYVDDYPRVREILDAWANLKTPRGLGPESSGEFVDALHVLQRAASFGEDAIERVVSMQLFGDSKRIEALSVTLDLLTADSLAAPARGFHEIIAGLGLMKEPQPMLLAGAGEVTVRGGSRARLVAPYTGFANHAIHAYAGQPRWVMTIENLTSFHLAARELDGSDRGLIVYTGGTPSPRWCAAYARILTEIDPRVPLYHWGDIDCGGFRIAALIRRRCIPDDRRYLPWLMDASRIGGKLKPVPESTRQMMAEWAARTGWTELAGRIEPVVWEQEGVAVRLPDLTS